MSARHERARLLRLEIARLLDEARSGHVELDDNADNICAAARALQAWSGALPMSSSSESNPAT
jgi:hypothetical protein